MMDKATLWSLRLGYSANQATTIKSLGIQAYLSQCFQAPYNQNLPDFLKDDPKTLLEIRDFRLKFNRLSAEEKKQIVIDGIRKTARLKVGKGVGLGSVLKPMPNATIPLIV